MNNPRWRIRKARRIDPWEGAWQVWECTNRPRTGVHREERLVCTLWTHEDCWAWLDARREWAANYFGNPGVWS